MASPTYRLIQYIEAFSKFAEIGIIRLVEEYGEAKRYDPDTNKHHHLRCRKCNEIVDFHDESFDNLRIPKSVQKNFSVTNVKVILEGTCNECIKKR